LACFNFIDTHFNAADITDIGHQDFQFLCRQCARIEYFSQTDVAILPRSISAVSKTRMVNTEGFLKYSQIFEGHISDCSTQEKIIDELAPRTFSSEHNPMVVLDAAIAKEDNFKLLKEKKFGYMCVSPSGIRQYSVYISSQPIKIRDKKGQLLVL
jgi:hypothetical protein